MEYKGMYFSNTEGLKNARPISSCPAVRQLSSNVDCMIGHYVDKNGRNVILLVNCDPERSARLSIDLGHEYESFSTERLGWFKPLLTNCKGASSALRLEPGCGILLR